MSDLPPFELPRVTDEDVTWVCDLLKLPKNAFSGADGNDPRLMILKSNETLDIEACPGSGKTTLLIAKLAILARHWTDHRRGICVLSHTNVARLEIEQRLGSTVQGKRLLSYPHFVGTIHGFVNEFLAIPWLRSKPFPIRMIDDEICQDRRWKKIPQVTRKALEQSGHDQTILKIANVDFSVGDIHWGKGRMLGKTTPTYQAIKAACKESCEEGFFCYDEMFVWGNELLDKVPEMRETLRGRFPILFIDEVQDNSELQSALLFRLFIEGDNPVVRQRFGDANQAIYQHAGQTEGATTDPFPDPWIRKDIPHSHRFGQDIADLANPLALQPQNLVGLGPCRDTITSDTEGKHAIFLFDDQTVGKVIPTYAHYLLELFSDQELRAGTFTAVGAIHRPKSYDKLPRFIGHYWPEYDCELTAVEPKPSTFYQYIQAGRKMAQESGETHYIVEKFADGLLSLVHLSNPLVNLANRRRKHRYILELLAEKPEVKAIYLDLISALVVEGYDPAADEWNTKWLAAITDIVQAIDSASPGFEEARDFLEWLAPDGGDKQTGKPRQCDNIFKYPIEEPKVQIHVGSIHSVKGQTHTGTLVLDTFFHDHNLATLKPWLLGQKSGRGNERVRNLSRLKQHYVAMTRPSHLLCLAIREDAFNENELNQLRSTPWRVARVTDADLEWL